LTSVYEKIDAPLVPVLARMEDAGVKVDPAVLGEMSVKLQREAATKARDIYERCGMEFNINSPKQLGDVLVQQAGFADAVKYGKEKRFLRRWMCWKDWLRITKFRGWCWNTGNLLS